MEEGEAVAGVSDVSTPGRFEVENLVRREMMFLQEDHIRAGSKREEELEELEAF